MDGYPKAHQVLPRVKTVTSLAASPVFIVSQKKAKVAHTPPRELSRINQVKPIGK